MDEVVLLAVLLWVLNGYCGGAVLSGQSSGTQLVLEHYPGMDEVVLLAVL